MQMSTVIFHCCSAIMVFKVSQNAWGHPKSCVSVFGCLSIMQTDSKGEVEQTVSNNYVLLQNCAQAVLRRSLHTVINAP